jgi:hypothetical protein
VITDVTVTVVGVFTPIMFGVAFVSPIEGAAYSLNAPSPGRRRIAIRSTVSIFSMEVSF